MKDEDTDNSPLRRSRAGRSSARIPVVRRSAGARLLASLGAIAAAVAMSAPVHAQTFTTLSASASPAISLPSRPVTLSADLVAPDLVFIGPPSGTVTFALDGVDIPGCTAVRFESFVQPTKVTCTMTAPAAGSYTIYVTYSGSASLRPSNAEFLFVVPSSYPADSPLPLAPDGRNSTFGALVTSSPVALTGFTGTRTISVAGGQYSIGCAGNYTTVAGTVKPDDILCVRHVTPRVGGAITRSVVTIGAVTSSFDSYADYWYDAPFGQEATVAAGISHTIVQPQYGYAVGWGDNTGGKLGNGTTASTSVPTEAFALGSVVAAGLEHSILAGSDSFAMGLNTAGQLGASGSVYSQCTVTGEAGLFPCSTQPVYLGSEFTNVVAAGAGWRHSLALKSDGTVWAWGSGFYGQNGKTADQATPALVSGINGTVVRIAAGYMHSVALLEDGTVVAWGSNQFGELGPDVATGTGTNPVPVPIPGLTNVVDIAAGASYTLALKSDGTVWSWGANIYGQLGDPSAPVKTAQNTAGFRAVPTMIPGLTGVRQISAGFSFALARKFDGTIVSWGLNERGQANGTPQSTPKNCGAALGRSCILSPTPVPGSAGYQQVYAGGAHSVLVDGQGRLKLFGDNSSGQLANRSGNFGAKFSQTTYDPDTFLNPAGVGGTPANVGRPSTAGGLDLNSLMNGLGFGNQPKGVKSEALVLSLNNLSETTALQVNGITASGDQDPGEFTIESDCPASLPPITPFQPGANSCLINVYFTPVALFERTGSLQISSNATDSSLMEFRLYGNGVDPRASSSVTLARTGGVDVVVGTPITFTASVTSTVAVSGTITIGQLPDGRYPMVPIPGCVDLPVVSDAASCTTSTLAEGFYQVIAVYSGSDTVQPSQNYPPLGFIVIPPITSYTLAVASVSGGGYGTGTVTSSPAGINGCVGCVAQFPVGTVVTLTATPSPGSVFAGWSGDCSGTGTCVVTMSANRSVSAPFTLLPAGQASLTVAKAGTGGGTVSSNPSGIDCGATCTANFATGTPVTLTATASAGSAFTGWSGGGCSGTGTCVVNLGASTTVTATFAPVANPPRLVNLSTRMQVGIGDNVLIGGLVIGGTAPKTVVIRARGPSLAAAGVQGALANPKLDIYAGQTLIATNDNWGVPSGQAAAIQATGFQPLDANEAAVLLTLAPGGYTAVVSGVGGTTGIALIEAFEVDLPQVPLINIATRGFVQAGDNVMIGGFVILGDAPQTVILRARGPSLTQVVNIANPLLDPVLSLYSGQTLLRENDNWANGPQALEIQSRGYAPTNANESAILVTLPPGGYTAIVSGAGGATGVALIEVFAVPAAP